MAVNEQRAQTPNPLTVREIYHMTARKTEKFGVEGYRAPTTLHYASRKCKFSTSDPPDMYYLANSRAKEPDPTKYAETLEDRTKRYWHTSNGKFSSRKKKTLTEEVSERSKSLPGPGSYFKNLTKNKEQMAKEMKLGRFESASEVPSAWKYNPKMKFVEKNEPNWKIIKDKPAKNKGKARVGPGTYYDGIVKSRKHVLKTSNSFTVPKAKRVLEYCAKAEKLRKFACVGSYKDVDLAYKNCVVLKKNRQAIFFPYKFRRFTEAVMEEQKGRPGPGSYNIGPPNENND